MNLQRPFLIMSLAVANLLGVATFAISHAADAKLSVSKPALTVTITTPQRENLPVRITANGDITAWQEASIGTEANGLRLASVRVNVGDVVKHGQVLATFAPEMIQADLNQTRAGIAEAEATLAEASANAQRARKLKTSGVMSGQMINQYLTAERTAKARLDGQRAAVKVQELRLQQTQVLAPDSGVISSRSATVGAVLPAGQELFRLIRQGRLEWRAEVPSADLALIKPGMAVSVTPANGASIVGKVRMLAPTVNDKTRNGIVYVDLGASADAKAGMFARGEFEIGSGQGLTLPQSAVLLRDGFNYVLRVGPDSKVVETKVAVGRRVSDRIEITSGLDTSARVVASGGGFLADGDVVRVVDVAPTKTDTTNATQ